MCVRTHKKLIQLFTAADSTRQISEFGPMMPLFREMYWMAAFLGLTEIADIAAGSAVYISRLQDMRQDWSEEISAAIKEFLTIITEYLKTQEDVGGRSPKDDNQKRSKIQISEKVDRMTAFFRQRQINLDAVSFCQKLTIDHAESANLSIKVPSFVKERHHPNRNLLMIYFDLKDHIQGIENLIKTLEDEIKKTHLLLHGPLLAAASRVGEAEYRSPYFLLLELSQSGKQWLEAIPMKGQVVNIHKKTENRRPVAPPPVVPKPPNLSKQPIAIAPPSRLQQESTNSDSLSFDGKKAMAVEPLEKIKTPRHSNKKRKIRNRDIQIRFSVGIKMQLIVSSIIIVAMMSLSFISLYFFRNETRNLIDDTNIVLTNLVAKQAETEIVKLFESANLLLQIGASANDSQTLIDDFFLNYQTLVYVGISGDNLEYYNRDWFRENRIIDEQAILKSILGAREAEIVDSARMGGTVIVNVSPFIPNLETPVLGLAAPFLLGTQQEALIILADIGGNLAESVQMQKGITTTVVVNSSGEILAHPDFSRIFNGETIKDTQLFSKMYSQGTKSGQFQFENETEDGPSTIIGSFTLMTVGNLGVMTTAREQDVFIAVDRIQILNVTLLGAILSITTLGIFFFTQSISAPLKELTLATRQIKAKNFAVSLKPHSVDEVGQLARHFLNMIPELEKVERFQEKIRKFINPQVALMIADNTLPTQAQTKDITVFFSDVRNFTKLSELMADPQLVLDNLSEYFRTVVPCIEQTRGIVDKFIGDAIMAVWGSMFDLPNTAESAINSALHIRKTLIDFNEGRGSIVQPVFHTGCGIHSGPATVGIMGGGSAKEEWAHMGDTVNLASRIEALNKPMGTDILISQATALRITDIFDLVLMNRIKVKGKSEPQKIYAVLGRMDDDNRPRSLTELRTILKIEGSFADVKAKEIKEEKFEILNS